MSRNRDDQAIELAFRTEQYQQVARKIGELTSAGRGLIGLLQGVLEHLDADEREIFDALKGRFLDPSWTPVATNRTIQARRAP